MRLTQMMRAAALIGLLMLSLGATAEATTYYVSNGGSDSNNGTSLKTPWATVGKVNSESFHAGDSILFERGGSWTERLTSTQHGAAGNPITYGAYGTGGNPSLRGVYAAHAEYLLFTHLTIEGSRGSGVFIEDSEAEPVFHVTVDNCVIRDNIGSGIFVSAPGRPSAVVISNNLIQHNSSTFLSQGILLAALDTVIYGNTIDNNGWNDQYSGSQPRSHGIYLGDLLRYGASPHIEIYDNVITRHQHGFGIKLMGGATVYRNVLTGNVGGAITVENNPHEEVVDIYSNVLSGNRYGVAFYNPEAPTVLRIYSNTFYHDGTGKDWYEGEIQMDNDPDELLIRDNIVFPAYDRPAYKFVPLHHADIDYNCVYQTGMGDLIKYDGSARTWSDWTETLGFDTHGQNEDPGMVNPSSGDFRLTPASPCRDAATTVGLTRDIAGSVVPSGSAPDIGAYEYVAGGRTYYTSNRGDDGSDGLSPDTPWATVGRVNSQALCAGDKILFERGGTWEQQLVMDGWAGSKGRPITVGAYGAGENPSLQGVSVRKSGDTAPSYIRLEHLTVEGCARTGVDIEGVGVHDVTVDDCVIRNNGGNGVYIWATLGPTRIVISNNTIRDNGSRPSISAGIMAFADDLVISGNTVENNGYNGRSGYCHGIYISADAEEREGTHFSIRDNVIRGNLKGAGIKFMGGGDIFRNVITRNGCSGIYLAETCGNDIVQNIYSNVVFGNTFGMRDAPENYTGTLTQNMYNNTFFPSVSQVAWTPCAEIYVQYPVTKLTMENNIIYAGGDSPALQLVTQPDAHIDHNCIYRRAGDLLSYGGSTCTWSQWQALGFDLHGLNEDPAPMNAGSGDFRLQSDSPCRDAGADVGLRRDIGNNSIPKGAAPDIGAYEYAGG